MLERLLNATIKALSEHGLDGATIPRIALLAGVAPASIYRRFTTKNALVEAAFTRALEKGGAASERLLQSLSFGEKTLAEGAEAIVDIVFRQYRAAPHFLHAFRQYTESEVGAEFRASAVTLLSRNLNHLVEALGACIWKSRDAFPKQRLRFGLLTTVTAIEAITLDPNSLWATVQPMTDLQIKSELASGLVSYISAA